VNFYESPSSRQRSEQLVQLDAVAKNPDYLNAAAQPLPLTTKQFEKEQDQINRVDYYFGYGIGPNNKPSLEAVKNWMDGDEQRFDTFTIAEYGMWEESQIYERELENTLKTQGLVTAINQAERMATANGYLDPNRNDPRVFFEKDAPADPFTTERERAMELSMTQEESSQNLEYRVDAIAANGASRLDVTKSWGDSDQEYERLLIPQQDFEIARLNAETANELLDKGDLQAAMMLVELSGIEAGVINADRSDPRLFTQGPPDPFTTIREREFNFAEMDTQLDIPSFLEPDDPQPLTARSWVDATAFDIQEHMGLEGAAWFDAAFKQSPVELLQPLHDTANYAVVIQGADPWTEELAVEKYWKEPGGYLGIQSVTLNTFDSDNEQAYEQAEQVRDGLLETYDMRGLEAMMHKAELTAMQNGWLDGGRMDSRLFTQGPTDRFETLAQQLEGEVNPYWNTQGEKIEEAQTEIEHPYWRLDILPVSDLQGHPLGQSLQMVVYPNIEQDPDAIDNPPIPKEEPFRMLEMAHFETTAAAEKFSKEFNSYIMPDILEGPELAEEVARLEGRPMEWKTLEGNELKAYQNDELVIKHDAKDWHPYNPNAEHDARIATEGFPEQPPQPFGEQNEAGFTPTTSELDF